MRKIVVVVLLSLLFGCGTGETPIGPYVIEQTDYYDGAMYHRFYRYAKGLGYATSADGIIFHESPKNPIMEDCFFPYQVVYKGNRYLLVQHQKGGTAFYLYDVNAPESPRITNGGRPVLVGGFFNVGVAVVGDRWHMLVEGKSSDTFHLRYTWADFPELDFSANIGPVIINDAGNPYLAYIPERDAILALYGADLRGAGYWRIRSATFDFTSWRLHDFVVGDVGIHFADPDIGTGNESNPVILTAGSNQDAVSTYLFSGSKLDLYDAIVSGHVELRGVGTTMEADT